MEALIVIAILVIIAVIALTTLKNRKKAQSPINPGGIDAPKDIEPLDPNIKPE